MFVLAIDGLFTTVDYFMREGVKCTFIYLVCDNFPRGEKQFSERWNEKCYCLTTVKKYVTMFLCFLAVWRHDDQYSGRTIQ